MDKLTSSSSGAAAADSSDITIEKFLPEDKRTPTLIHNLKITVQAYLDTIADMDFVPPASSAQEVRGAIATAVIAASDAELTAEQVIVVVSLAGLKTHFISLEAGNIAGNTALSAYQFSLPKLIVEAIVESVMLVFTEASAELHSVAKKNIAETSSQAMIALAVTISRYMGDVLSNKDICELITKNSVTTRKTITTAVLASKCAQDLLKEVAQSVSILDQNPTLCDATQETNIKSKRIERSVLRFLESQGSAQDEALLETEADAIALRTEMFVLALATQMRLSKNESAIIARFAGDVAGITYPQVSRSNAISRVIGESLGDAAIYAVINCDVTKCAFKEIGSAVAAAMFSIYQANPDGFSKEFNIPITKAIIAATMATEGIPTGVIESALILSGIAAACAASAMFDDLDIHAAAACAGAEAYIDALAPKSASAARQAYRRNIFQHYTQLTHTAGDFSLMSACSIASAVDKKQALGVNVGLKSVTAFKSCQGTPIEKYNAAAVAAAQEAYALKNPPVEPSTVPGP